MSSPGINPPAKICNFCKMNPATQKNSHIFTSFLTTSLKKTGSINRVYTLQKFSPSGNYPFSQDTPKENFLFCPDCEALFAKEFETPIANTFYPDYLQKRNFFNVLLRTHAASYRVFTRVDYTKFKKFIFLQLYRAHLSSLREFAHLKLKQDQHDIIYNNLKDALTFNDIKVTVFTTDLIDNKSSNIIFGCGYKQNGFLLFINEFIFVIQFDNSETFFSFSEHAACFQTNSIRVLYLDLTTWELLKTIISFVIGTQK
jgi:hypothetical protein